MNTKTQMADPRASFKGRSDDELDAELTALDDRSTELAQKIASSRPTREEVEERIARAQERAVRDFPKVASAGVAALLSDAVAGSEGYRPAETLARVSVLASDDLADTLRRTLAADRPKAADLAPLHDEQTQISRRISAIEAELELRELDARRDAEEEERQALVARMTETA